MTKRELLIKKQQNKFCKWLKSLFCCFKKHDNDVDYLINIIHENTVPFVPPISVGKVIKVYDGDTFTIISKLPYQDSPIYRFSVRLNGIDSPEIKGKTGNEKELARKSRDALSGLIMGKIVTLKNTSLEKYGRVLADVYINDLCINEWMIENNYAIKYNRGTKVRSIEWN
jgi:endonuclease YncB( thermonuclease family)